jgi:hypothetical protein
VNLPKEDLSSKLTERTCRVNLPKDLSREFMQGEPVDLICLKHQIWMDKRKVKSMAFVVFSKCILSQRSGAGSCTIYCGEFDSFNSQDRHLSHATCLLSRIVKL